MLEDRKGTNLARTEIFQMRTIDNKCRRNVEQDC